MSLRSLVVKPLNWLCCNDGLDHRHSDFGDELVAKYKTSLNALLWNTMISYCQAHNQAKETFSLQSCIDQRREVEGWY